MRGLVIPEEVLEGRASCPGSSGGVRTRRARSEEPIEINLLWGSERVAANREKSDLSLRRWISRFIPEYDGKTRNPVTRDGTPILAGLLAQERISSWGQITPPTEIHSKINDDIMEGLGIANKEGWSENRPVVLLNIWRLSPISSVSIFFLLPIPVTSMNDIGAFDSSVIREAERSIYVEDPSSTRTDSCMRVQSYGRLKLTGRLALSVASEAIKISKDTRTGFEESEPISLHLGSARVMYFVVVGHRTELCTLTLRSLEMIGRMSRGRRDVMFDEFLSATIYADMGDMKTRQSSNSCIRMTIDGSIRYLGKSLAVKKTFSKLREVLELPFESALLAADFVSTLSAIPG